MPLAHPTPPSKGGAGDFSKRPAAYASLAPLNIRQVMFPSRKELQQLHQGQAVQPKTSPKNK